MNNLNKRHEQERGRLNEFQVAVALFVWRIYNSTRANYERLYGTNQRQHVNNQWDWRGFPRLPVIFTYYQHASNAYMIYVAVRNLILLDHLKWFIKLEKPTHCYLVGYFHVNPVVSRDGATILALLHLGWRSYQALIERPYFVPLALFLNFSERDLRRAIRHQANETIDLAYVLRPINEEQPSKLFKRVLCYKIEYNNHTNYKLRPNRTLEARHKLRKRVSLSIRLVGGTFLFIMLVTSITILCYELNDKQYLVRYPGCDLDLELKNARNELSNWSYSAHAHQLLTFVANEVESFIIWFDSGVALMCLWTSIYLLNYDTMLHWTALDQKLQRVHLEVRAEYLKWPMALSSNEDEEDADWVREMDGCCRHCSFLWREYPCMSTNRIMSMPPMPLELEEALRDLQAHFFDFFQQIGESDMMVSDIITSTVLIWLIAISFSGYKLQRLWLTGHSDEHLGLVVVILFCESVSFIMVTAVSFSMLELHRNCLRSYETLCSLMAFDRSKYKLRLSKLLQIYTVKQRSAYTIFQQYPYTKTTYMSIFGWSLSCLFILDNLIRR